MQLAARAAAAQQLQGLLLDLHLAAEVAPGLLPARAAAASAGAAGRPPPPGGRERAAGAGGLEAVVGGGEGGRLVALYRRAHALLGQRALHLPGDDGGMGSSV